MRRPLKVAHVLIALGIGGMEKVVVDIIKRFNPEKVRSSVYCLVEEGSLAAELKDNDVEVTLVKGNKYLSLAGAFRERCIDIVHSYSGVYRDATVGAIIAGVPIRVHTDQGRFYPDSRWTRFNHWFFSHFRDKVIPVSDELGEFLKKEVGIHPKKIKRIYNAVDVADHDVKIDIGEKRRELNIQPGEKVIGVIARLVPVKDHETLLRAFKRVKELCKNVKLLIVGYGPLEESLNRLVKELGEEDSVLFLGKRTDVRELLHIMDIVCLSSRNEGLSLTLTEAMASGKAVVATNVGGNPELVVNGVTGLLVPAAEPDKMAEAIITLLRDDSLRGSMGAEGKKRIEREFNIRNVVTEYERLYYDLATEKGIL